MEKAEYKKHYELEEDFWWFRGRRDIILATLRPLLVSGQKLKILDSGCGTGFNLKFFERHGEAFGCDLSPDALYFCLKRGLKKVARANVDKLPFHSQSFELVTCLDVIYHKNIKSDVQVLQEARRVLKKGGCLLITDSAFNFLRSKHDIAFQARERYRKKILNQRLEKAGFHILKMSYFNFFLFVFVLLRRFLSNILPVREKKVQSDLKAIDKRLNAWLYNVLIFEAFLTKHLSLPFGSSILCLAQRRESI